MSLPGFLKIIEILQSIGNLASQSRQSKAIKENLISDVKQKKVKYGNKHNRICGDARNLFIKIFHFVALNFIQIHSKFSIVILSQSLLFLGGVPAAAPT